MLIRAAYDEHTLTVYQAYAPGIAGPAVAQHSLAVPALVPVDDVPLGLGHERTSGTGASLEN
jgi:hypothetical protein